MALDERTAFAGQRHVREVLIAELLAQHRQQIGFMVVPPQTELLLHSRFAYHKCSLKDLWVVNLFVDSLCQSWFAFLILAWIVQRSLRILENGSR